MMEIGPGALILLFFAALVVAILLLLLLLTRIGFLIRATIPDRPRRRLFISSIAFLVTFLGVRILVSLITRHIGPFHWVMVGGRHIHHLVWGILILLFIGYGWLLDLGRKHTPISIFFSRLMAVSYGAGAALTLDEFALWLNLDPDAYWTRQGRVSIDAVILFGGLLAVGAWGAPFFRGLRQLWDKRSVVEGKLKSPIRLVRLLRPRKAQQSPPSIEP
jgi:hypothetical protein